MPRIRGRSSTRALLTLGYEGLTIDEFVDRVKAVGVDVVIDVRELPLSRKKGFSKTALGEALGAVGVEYTHWRSLGAPKEIRDRYRLDQDWGAYVRGFATHLEARNGDVQNLAALASEKQACLVCFEADFDACHRSLVARAAHLAGGPPVKHVTPKTVLVDP